MKIEIEELIKKINNLNKYAVVERECGSSTEPTKREFRKPDYVLLEDVIKVIKGEPIEKPYVNLFDLIPQD